MAHWFHRNPIKATEKANYELGKVLASSDASKIATEARLTRSRLLEHYLNAAEEREIVENDFNNYMKLLTGFVIGLDEKGGDSKLRHLQKFAWSDSLLGLKPLVLADFWFELFSICICQGVWLMKYAARVAAKDEVNDREAKLVHSSLRKAAGIFEYVQQEKGRLSDSIESGADLTAPVLQAYSSQCTAEAQEVTVARAVDLKHNAGLIASLCLETANLFEKGDIVLQQQSDEVIKKWRLYFQAKAALYTAYAHAYNGESLLSQDKCGAAVKACREGLTCYEKAEKLCAEYSKTKGPGLTAKLEAHQFFLRIKPKLNMHLEKAERENGFIYHQKIPEEVPPLESKETFGLVKPDEFNFPPESQAPWSKSVYAQFDITKASTPEFAKAKRKDKLLPEPKEAKVYQSESKHKTESGCSIQ